jgi:ABC-2 type transport system permease protein
MSIKGIEESLAFFAFTMVYKFKTMFAYRFQALIWIIWSGFTSFYSLITLTIIYNVSSGIPGWSYFQILALSYVMTVALNVIWLIIEPWQIVDDMKVGALDPRLIRPYGIVTILLSMPDLWPVSIAGVAGGLFILVYSLYHVSFSIVSLLEFIPLFVGGIAALILFITMMSLVSYYLFRSAHFVSRMMSVLSTAGSYPLSVYGTILTLLFTVALPIGVASYYPSEVLFGRISTLQYLAAWTIIILVIVGSYNAINTLMKHYTSGGG